MDPVANIKMQRLLAREIIDLADSDDVGDNDEIDRKVANLGLELAELVDAYATWVAKGGQPADGSPDSGVRKKRQSGRKN